MYQRIMVPLDGSELAQSVLPHALAICRAFGATLLLLYVRDQQAASGVPIEILVREGPVAAAIVDTGAEERIDMITMATHGRSGLQRAVYGSVAEQVLRSSSKPVLLVRVPGAHTEAP